MKLPVEKVLVPVIMLIMTLCVFGAGGGHKKNILPPPPPPVVKTIGQCRVTIADFEDLGTHQRDYPERLLTIKRRYSNELIALFSSVPDVVDGIHMRAWAESSDETIKQIEEYALSTMGGRINIRTMIIRRAGAKGEKNNGLYVLEITLGASEKRVVVRYCVEALGSDPADKSTPVAISELVPTGEPCFASVSSFIKKGNIMFPLEITWKNPISKCDACTSGPRFSNPVGKTVVSISRPASGHWRIAK